VCVVAAHAPTLVGAPAPMSSVPTPGLLLGWKLRTVMESMFTLLLRTACSSTPVLTTYWSCVRITPTPCVPASLQHRHHIRLALAPHRPASATMRGPHTAVAVPNISARNLSQQSNSVAGNLVNLSQGYSPNLHAPECSSTFSNYARERHRLRQQRWVAGRLAGAAKLAELFYQHTLLIHPSVLVCPTMIHGQDTPEFSASTCNAHEHGRLQRHLQRQRLAGRRRQRSRIW